MNSSMRKIGCVNYARFPNLVTNKHAKSTVALLDNYIKTHDSKSRGQEEAGRTRDEQVSYLHVALL